MSQSLLRKAIRYIKGLWVELNRYVEDGEVEIDDNPVYAARGNHGYAASRLMPRGSLEPGCFLENSRIR